MKPEPTATPIAEPKRGLICPRCGCEHLPVLYTRQKLDHILRVRECRHCGRRITARERQQ